MDLNSPKYVRLSLAAAITLRFERGLFYRDAKLYCINILLTYNDGCKAACAFCGLNRNATGGKFIRVKWPVYKIDDIIKRIKTVDHLNRICVGMITHPNAYSDLKKIVHCIKEGTELPISTLIAPSAVPLACYSELKQIGVEMIGIAIDTATKELFEKLRGKGVDGPHKWDNYWLHVKNAVDVFGKGNVGVHFIAGLGETEQEIVYAIQHAMNLGANTHLFSFFPEQGTFLENQPQPPIESYRMVQLARYLINDAYCNSANFKYDMNGRILDFNLPSERLEKIIESGLPFLTSGCPNKSTVISCNRPYSNETPSQALKGQIRNYPFPPTDDDINLIKSQLRLYQSSLQ